MRFCFSLSKVNKLFVNTSPTITKLEHIQVCRRGECYPSTYLVFVSKKHVRLIWLKTEIVLFGITTFVLMLHKSSHNLPELSSDWHSRILQTLMLLMQFWNTTKLTSWCANLGFNPKMLLYFLSFNPWDVLHAPKAVTPLESSNLVIHTCGHSGFCIPKVSPGSGFHFIFKDKQK